MTVILGVKTANRLETSEEIQKILKEVNGVECSNILNSEI